jgi:hypothetical protein
MVGVLESFEHHGVAASAAAVLGRAGIASRDTDGVDDPGNFSVDVFDHDGVAPAVAEVVEVGELGADRRCTRVTLSS